MGFSPDDLGGHYFRDEAKPQQVYWAQQLPQACMGEDATEAIAFIEEW
jgi:hypothetical protein